MKQRDQESFAREVLTLRLLKAFLWGCVTGAALCLLAWVLL